MLNKTILAFGLSADPIHQAHVDLVVDVVYSLEAQECQVAKVILIPVYRRNPVGSKKKDQLPETFEDRYAMCQLASEEIRRRLVKQGASIQVSRIEERLAKPTTQPNYTVETLEVLHMEEGRQTSFVFPLSSDLVSGDDPEFGHWHQSERLIQLAAFAICPRPGYRKNEAFLMGLERKGARFVYLDDIITKDISARQIKARIRNGEDPLKLSEEGLVPKAVARYIRECGLYRDGEPLDHSRG